MPQVLDWTAIEVGNPGRTISRGEVPSIASLQLDKIRVMDITTDYPGIGVVSARLRPDRGEQIRVFTRRKAEIGVVSGAPVGESGTVVIEIVPDPTCPEQFVRLYVHNGGLLLSTEDLFA
jgi:hypothetical protein